MTDVSAVRSLRLRAPRLELRLGDRSELEALARVAVAGIDPPHEMPVAVPWTGASAEPGFVDDSGRHVERPRREPVVHHDLVLGRAKWSCPVAVELEGVEACVPLFGAAPA